VLSDDRRKEEVEGSAALKGESVREGDLLGFWIKKLRALDRGDGTERSRTEQDQPFLSLEQGGDHIIKPSKRSFGQKNKKAIGKQPG